MSQIQSEAEKISDVDGYDPFYQIAVYAAVISISLILIGGILYHAFNFLLF